MVGREVVERTGGGIPSPMSSLRRQIASGMFWNVLQAGVSRAISALTTMVLLWYLSPNDFGVLAAALVVIALLEPFNDAGLSKELIFRQDRLEEAYDTAFWLGLAFNGALFALVLLARPLIQSYSEDPDVTRIAAWLSVSLVITGAGILPRTILQKELLFKKAALRDIVAPVIGGGLALLMAVAGYGVWSLVARHLIGNLASLALLWWVCPYRPKFRVDMGLAWEMVSYGKHLVAHLALMMLAANLDRLLAVRLVGSTALGFYAVAMLLVELPVRVVSQAIGQVMFPVFSMLQADRTSVARAYVKGIRLIAIILVPLQVALAVLGPSLIQALYGERWEATGQLLPTLAVYGILGGLAMLAGEVFKGMGHTWLASSASLFQLALLLALLLGLGTWLGIFGIAVAATLAMGARFALDAYRVSALVNIAFADIGGACFKPIVYAGLAFAPVAWLLTFGASLVWIGVLGVGGMMLYGAALWWSDRKFTLEMLESLGLLKTTTDPL